MNLRVIARSRSQVSIARRYDSRRLGRMACRVQLDAQIAVTLGQLTLVFGDGGVVVRQSLRIASPTMPFQRLDRLPDVAHDYARLCSIAQVALVFGDGGVVAGELLADRPARWNDSSASVDWPWPRSRLAMLV